MAFSKQPAKKPQGPVTLLRSTYLVPRTRSEDRGSAFAGRRPWNMFLGNDLCLEHIEINTGCGLLWLKGIVASYITVHLFTPLTGG